MGFGVKPHRSYCNLKQVPSQDSEARLGANIDARRYQLQQSDSRIRQLSLLFLIDS
jgi:hypothetical protein